MISDLTSYSLSYALLLSHFELGLMAVAVVFLCLLSAFFLKPSLLPRLLISLLFLYLFLGPTLSQQERQEIEDKAVILVDRSASQMLGTRPDKTERLLAHLRAQDQGLDNLSFDIIEAGSTDAPETHLFEPLRSALLNIPASERAGAIILTDGHIHDVPEDYDTDKFGPLHFLLTGQKNEIDDRIVITHSPKYGITGQDLTIRFRVETSSRQTDIPVTVRASDKDDRSMILNAVPGEEIEVSVPIKHPDNNIFMLSIPVRDGELTDINNTAILSIEGIRDRLKVLLVSGQPHMGGRMWRNILKSDPAVDLIHFTILREPHTQDPTPQRELSLIPFPFRELFEEKLYEFDLIIFDRYSLNQILPPHYFDNITRYVREGGALLVSNGSEYDGSRSIYNSGLNAILPGAPSGSMRDTAFTPTLTSTGRAHPVSTLIQTENTLGNWLRQIPVRLQNPDDKILLTGIGQTPLLIIGEREDGRIAQITSDHLWFWERGYNGGGPYLEFLRRLVHWLMKEPDLEEDRITLDIQNGTLNLTLRSADTMPPSITLEYPDQSTKTISFDQTNTEDYLYTESVQITQPGLYTARHKDQTAYIVYGAAEEKEFQHVKTDISALSHLLDQRHIKSYWYKDTPPRISHIEAGRKMGGQNVIGLRDNNSFTVLDVTSAQPLTLWLSLLALLTALLAGWWWESRR